MTAARWTALHVRLDQTLQKRSLLPHQARVLVAVSGGQDSLCLMRLLLDLKPKWQWQLAVVHCNHRWRADAAANAEYVEQLAHAWQVPYFSETAAEPVPCEAAARAWRYQVMASCAVAQGYSRVVTGHTASDRAETLLYNLLRGSGADGLQALSWQRPLTDGVQLVRPLLNVSRAETAEFCRAAHLNIWHDSTNQDWSYARNRIRQELLPYLQAHFNPQVEKSLAQTAELLQADVAYLEAAAVELWQQAVEEQPLLRLNRRVLQSAPLALQRRVMRQFLQKTLPTAPTFEHIEKMVTLITAPNRSQTDPFPGSVIARVEGDWVHLCPLPNRDASTSSTTFSI
ncbi:MAG: tRNA lysidine(34) synthetase TilS [Synechococcales cyanobacterium C42_A2020_086]|jgi:tRNA(Ile)-lysidine synthase|nr:tRNA lysidine(34) synthetase TilS [Synechococcales cyanobacterium C42_A2020_086]